jgi:hypothetical protein
MLALMLAVTGATAVMAGNMGAKKVVLSNQNNNTNGGTGVTDTFTINPATTGSTIKCVKIVYATAQGGSTLPTGMVTTSASYNSAGSSGLGTMSSWTNDATTNGTFKLTFTTGSTPSNPVVLRFTGITNPTSNGTYFASVATFGNTDCSTTPLDNDDVAFVIADSSVTVTATVNETLTFSLGSTSVGLGTLSTGSVSTGTGNMTVATNAANGYGINASGTTLTKGSDTVPFVTDGTPVTAGTAGYGLRVTTCGSGATCSSTQDIGTGLTTGVTDLMSRTSPTTGDTHTVTYRASINAITPAGAYSSLVSYVAVGKF